MIRLCTLLIILIVKTRSQLDECPSCCHHSFNESSIIPFRPTPFADCTNDEKFVIHVVRCFSDCLFKLPPPKITPDSSNNWPLLNLRNLTRTQSRTLAQCYQNCSRVFNPAYCTTCNGDDSCIAVCTEFSHLLNDTMGVNQPSPPMHPAFFTITGGNHIRIESRDSSFSDNTMDEGSGEPMNEQVLLYGFVIKLFSPNTNATSYCPLVDNRNFGSFIRNISHLCTPTQLSYAVVNRYGVSDYSPANTECLGEYSKNDARGFNDIQTRVNKDLRPGYEGHNVVEISWEVHSTHEPQCIGEYEISISPSSQNDEECKNKEILIATVDKSARSHRFQSNDPAFKLFNDSCAYDILVYGRRIPEILGDAELAIDDTTPFCHVTKIVGMFRRLNRRRVQFTFSSDHPQATFWCKIDDKVFIRDCISPLRLSRRVRLVQVRAFCLINGKREFQTRKVFKNSI